MTQATVYATESIDDIYGGFEIGNLDALTADVKAEEDEDLMNAFMSGIDVSFTGFEEFRQWWDSFSYYVSLEKSSMTHLKFKILTGEESDEEGKGWFWVDMLRAFASRRIPCQSRLAPAPDAPRPVGASPCQATRQTQTLP